MKTPTKDCFSLTDIIRSFENAAQNFDDAAFLQREIAQRLIEHFELMRLQPKTILDLGAKTGFTTQLLQKKFPTATVIAFDLTEKMLQKARRQSGWFKRQNCVCASLEKLPLKLNSVDLIFSNLALPWCVDFQACLKEVFNILAPHGLFIFSTLGPGTLAEIRHSWAEVDNAIHVHPFMDMHDIGDALRTHHFSDPVIEMEYLTLTYPDAFAAMNELKATGQHNIAAARNRGLTGKRKFKKFLKAYEQYRLEDGTIPVTFEIIYGHAWKPQATPANPGEIIIPLTKIGRRNG